MFYSCHVGNTKQLSLTKVIIVDDNVFELSWKNNNNNDETLKYDYTLFWCEKDVNRPFECNVRKIKINNILIIDGN